MSRDAQPGQDLEAEELGYWKTYVIGGGSACTDCRTPFPHSGDRYYRRRGTEVLCPACMGKLTGPRREQKRLYQKIFEGR